MINIPTELLRTLVAVVDLRSFTKAAHSLGVTQPAVSAQIKRLQILLGGELFDKSAPGVTLTEKGEVVVNYARRLLSINDRILHLAAPQSSLQLLRVGVPWDFAGDLLPVALAEFRRRWPHLRFQLRGQSSDSLLRDLRQGELDVVVALTQSEPALDAHQHWNEDVAWANAGAKLDAAAPVPLVTHDATCILYRVATQALNHAGRDWEIVFNGVGSVALIAAVRAGLGVCAVIRRLAPGGLVVPDDSALPKIPSLVCGIYLRDESTGADRSVLETLAETIADTIRPPLPLDLPGDLRSGELRAGNQR
jgi:DNA-binding transcriptional LysR family regulator